MRGAVLFAGGLVVGILATVVVMRTLENEPDRRYQAASEVKSDIDSIGKRPPTVQTQPAKSSYVPQPPVKQTLAQASRKVRAPARCLQTIGYLSITFSVLMLLMILVSVALLMPARRSGGQIDATQVSGSVASLSIQRGHVPFLDSTASMSGIRFPILIAQEGSQATTTRLSFFALVLPAICLFHLPISIMMIVAGRKMVRFESYGFVLVTCLLAMLPINPLFFLFSFIVAIWTLIVLNNPTVQQAFEERKFSTS